ncbi:CGNR zinc finger domain-containing protein [Streptomyces dysideae]|uniref:CGNR zinc finger domain-containing protein n=1 Tax=Streptomyces dysideae TaxID=909626 RepID=UPI00389B1D23
MSALRFLDRSPARNRRRRSMSRCGNRTQVRPQPSPRPGGVATPRRPEPTGGLSHHEHLAQPHTASRRASLEMRGWGRSRYPAPARRGPVCLQRIWASTREPHPRCRASTAGPSGSAR